jgi:hypothetical protein
MGGEPMSDIPQPENRSWAEGWSQPQAQPSPPDDAIPPAGGSPQYQQYQAGTATRAGTRPPFDFGRLRRGDLIAGIASFIVFITLFLPWYSFAAAAASASETATPAQQQLVLAICADQPAVCSSQAPPQFSVGGLSGVGGGWHYLILVVAIIAVLYVLSRATDAMPQAARYHWQTLLGLTALQGLLVLIAFVDNPLSLLDSVGSSGWGVGAILALIAAIAAVSGAVLVMQESKKQSGVSPAVPGAAAG